MHFHSAILTQPAVQKFFSEQSACIEGIATESILKLRTLAGVATVAEPPAAPLGEAAASVPPALSSLEPVEAFLTMSASSVLFFFFFFLAASSAGAAAACNRSRTLISLSVCGNDDNLSSHWSSSAH